MTSRRVVFGLVVPAPTAGMSSHRVQQHDSQAVRLANSFDRLGALLGKLAGLEVGRHEASGYEALATEVRAGRVDVAWLPPIVFVRLADAVTPLGSILRDGKTAYEAALVVRSDSRIKTIEGLRGARARAGWVDPWSAAGFVLPRVKLALLGVDPRNAFRTETFHGSHRAAMEALVEGACDVAGTYAQADAAGDVTTGAWSEIEGADVRVLATFGAIPPDVIGTRRGLPDDDRAAILHALRTACAEDDSRAIVRQVFNGDELHEGLVSGYEGLQSALDVASARGLFD